MKQRLIFKLGRRWREIDLVYLISTAFEISKSEAKRLIKQDAFEIYLKGFETAQVLEDKELKLTNKKMKEVLEK